MLFLKKKPNLLQNRDEKPQVSWRYLGCRLHRNRIWLYTEL